MDLDTTPHLLAVIESYDFGSLLQAVTEAASRVLGEDLAGSAELFLAEGGGDWGWLISPATLNKRRIFSPCLLSPEWTRRLARDEGVHLVAESADWPAKRPDSAEPGPAVKPLAIGLGAPDRRIGVLLLPLHRAAEEPGLEAREDLVQLARTVARVAPRILLHERAELQGRQIQHLSEGLVKALTAPNKSALLASLLVVLNRQFGLSRIVIAQVHPETHTLRSELHSGFGAGFATFAIPLEQADHPLILAMTRGDVLIHDAMRGEIAETLPEFLRGERAERRVLMPLLIGMRPVGLIYADQPAHDGTPYFRPVFELFARLAAAALENLTLRLRAEQLAETDALTGLYNRYFLDKILEIEIPRVKRYNHSISLLMLDLCDFKHFNDTYGHLFGDYVLRETASLLQANVRRPDIVVRYGGDEFVVLMVNTTHEQALLVKERIERAFIERNRMQTDERSVIKISIGLRSADAATIESLLHEADKEMYAHKAHQTRLLLIEALLSGNIEKIEAADRIVGSLCNILYKKAPYYPDHARRVAHLALILARRMGLEDGEVETLVLAALLHDVGKVSIPTEILQKREPLTAPEMSAVRHHPALGEEFFQGLEHLEPVRPVIRSHHERYDGQVTGEFPGYPDGLCGDRIPLGARILRLAESVEVMLNGLNYRQALAPEALLRVVRAEAGKSFDPQLANILLGDRSWMEGLGDPARIRELFNLEA